MQIANTTEQHAHPAHRTPTCSMATSWLEMLRRQELRRGRTRDTAQQAAASWATQAQGRPAALIELHGACPVRGNRCGRRQRAALSAHGRQRRHACRRAHPPEVPEVGAQRRPELPRSYKPSERAHWRGDSRLFCLCGPLFGLRQSALHRCRTSYTLPAKR